MKFSELIERVRARGVVAGEVRVGGDPEIGGVCEDSRKVKAGDLFVARGGTKRDGAEFVGEAIARGAVAVVSGNSEFRVQNSDVAWAHVEDVNLACALLAHEVAGNPTGGMTMIAVTGTKGKTTVAYLMRWVLQWEGLNTGMIGTVEIYDGKKVAEAEMTTPGSVELVELFSRMKANGVTHCVMEVSSHALHQKRVAGIDWAVAIFTNLTGDHLDYHKTMEEYGAAKQILFEGLKPRAFAVVNMDDAWGKRMAEKSAGAGARVVPYGYGENMAVWEEEAGWAAEIQEMSGSEMRIAVRGRYFGNWRRSALQRISMFSPPSISTTTLLVGRHNVYNVLAVVAAADSLDLDIWRILAALTEAPGAPGRLQRVTPAGMAETAFSVFVDYAHTHDALENVLKALRTTMEGVGTGAIGGGPSGESNLEETESPGTTVPGVGERGKLICVFGCGGDRDRTKRPKMGKVAEELADVVIATSDNPRTEEPGAILREIRAGFSEGWEGAGKIQVEADRRAAIKMAIGMAKKGDIVLIAGKGHEKYQIVGTAKQHFDDVEEAEAAMRERMAADGQG